MERRINAGRDEPSAQSGEPTPRSLIGKAGATIFEVMAWSPAAARVDLSVACMFEHEFGGTSLSGGLLELDVAMSLALTDLRRQGTFRAEEMETLLVTKPPEAVRALSMMVIGLGLPVAPVAARVERAARLAMREAIRAGAKTVAFAPSLLDSGIPASATSNVAAAMLRGALGGLAAQVQLADRGLAAPPDVKWWAFDAGASHFASALAAFNECFEALVSCPAINWHK